MLGFMTSSSPPPRTVERAGKMRFAFRNWCRCRPLEIRQIAAVLTKELNPVLLADQGIAAGKNLFEDEHSGKDAVEKAVQDEKELWDVHQHVRVPRLPDVSSQPEFRIGRAADIADVLGGERIAWIDERVDFHSRSVVHFLPTLPSR